MKRTIRNIALGLVIMLAAYAFLYGMRTEEELTDFLGFLWAVAQLVLFVLFVKFVLVLLRYTRALFKRAVLLRKIKKLANKSSYSLNVKGAYYTSVFRRSDEPEMEIRTPNKTYEVKFFPCLKKKLTYVLNNTGGYYTINKYTPTYLIRGMLRARIPLQKIQASHSSSYIPSFEIMNVEGDKDGVNAPTESKKEHILCVHPISVSLEVVRTNRPEPVFDGEKFLGYTVYSGNGLYNMLKNETKRYIN